MQPSLPTGTVTFLFTDIEDSAGLAQQSPAEMPGLLARHNAILRQSIEAHHGHVFRIVGDAFCAAFFTATDALRAALQAQRQIQQATWHPAQLKVRMGIHTGPAQAGGNEEQAGGFSGYLTLTRAQRVMSSAHGGQVLISSATAELVRGELPEGVELRDMGEQRLKGLPNLERLWQATAPDLLSEFPALPTLHAIPNNLPVQASSFIGRSREIGEVKQLLSGGRLLTLTGPGGSGKTRLALHVAAETIDDFRDGVYFVALAPINDAGLVAATIAQTLGIPETAGRSILDSLKDYLQSKPVLLLLDNFEQVISAASLVAELLAACSQLKVLVTSREGLHISGEQEYPVPPLALPDLTQLPPPESISQYAAVELFIQRAQAVKPDFQITNDTAPAVAEICHRLDGLPLAIELAAARIKLLPPQAMLARLEHRLEFLTGGRRDLPRRQQTLRNTIAWSYDLLDEDEQKMFRQASVFVGGCTVEAVEAVAGEPAMGFSVLDRLGSLLDKSLLREGEGVNGEARFVMLEMLREFGLEQLAASGEQETIRRRHAEFFLALAEQAEASLARAEQVEWMNRMEQEHGNLRLALEWSKTAEGDGVGEICLRLAGALGKFWEAHGHFTEGRERLSAILLKEAAQGRTAARARILARAGELAYRQSDYPATISFSGESLEIYRQIGDRQGAASALIKLGNAATEVGDYAAAAEYLEEALAAWRELEDTHGTARALISLGWNALRSGDYHLAQRRLEEALTISRKLGDTRNIGFELAGLGEVAMRQGDYGRATRMVEESLELRRQLGNKWGVGVSLGILGWVAMRERDWDEAAARLGESLEVRQEIGDRSGSAWCLERLAEIASAQGKAEKAARLFGAAAALRASIGSVIDSVDQPEYENGRTFLRTELGEERFTEMWDEGGALTLEQAVAYALER